MKKLRNILVIAVLAVILPIISASANNGTKVADSKVVHAEVTDLLKNSDIKESGIVNITFRLKNNCIKVFGVQGSNSQLNKQVKSLLESNRIYLKGQMGYYSVQINMNGANEPVTNDETRQELKAMIAEVLAISDITCPGKATVLFKVNGSKRLEVVEVTSENDLLVSLVKKTIDNANMLAPEGATGGYEIDVVF
jgi:hypothetical protein